jgi:hypothetical protein
LWTRQRKKHFERQARARGRVGAETKISITEKDHRRNGERNRERKNMHWREGRLR